MKSIRNMQGFTLIELLVVVAIIGILAAIAIPQFAAYRQKGFDARAESDLRNAATAEEAYYAANPTIGYATCSDAGCKDPALPGFQLSPGVKITMTGTLTAFTGTAKHDQGSGKTWSYNSETGGIQP